MNSTLLHCLFEFRYCFCLVEKKTAGLFPTGCFFIKYIEGENVPCYFMLKACCPIMVPSAKI